MSLINRESRGLHVFLSWYELQKLGWCGYFHSSKKSSDFSSVFVSIPKMFSSHFPLGVFFKNNFI